MKVSCLPVALFQRFFRGEMDIPAWASLAGSCGLDGFDLSTHFFASHAPALLAPVKEHLAACPIGPVMVVTYPDFSNPSRIQRERELAYLCRDIALSSELGARYIRVLAGQAHPGLDRTESIRRVVDYLSRADDLASRFGVQLVYENHSKPSAWTYTDFSYPTDIFLEIAAGLSATGVRINFDTANVLAYGDDTLEVLERVVDRVETVHVADSSAKGKLSPCRIGDGLAPLEDIFARLVSRGFDGWLCIEDCVSTTREEFAESARRVRSLWAAAGLRARSRT